MPLENYPPEVHILRALGIETEVPDHSSSIARLEVTPYLLGADGGVRAGVLAVLLDVVGGALAIRALHPDRMATADLDLQVVGVATGPVIEARASVVRRGRTTLVVEADLVNVGAAAADGAKRGGEALVGWATVTFAVLPRRGEGSVDEDGQARARRPVFASSPLDRPVADAVSITVVDPAGGRTWMPIEEYVHNSFGAVQGGVMALIGEVAGVEAVGASLGLRGPATAVDLHVTYLTQGRVGPITTRARSVTSGAGIGTAIVELVDEGAGDRLNTVVSVGAVAP